MARRKSNPSQAGTQLDALVAERVFGWKNVHRQSSDGEQYWGKKPDKRGRFRSSKVPGYSTDARLVPDIEDQMKTLKLFEKYQTQVNKIAGTNRIPAAWISPDQRCRAALNAVKNRGALRAVKG